MDVGKGRPQEAWDRLRGWVGAQVPYLSAPPPAGPGLCASCWGPAHPGHARCYQCELHAQCAPGSLADLVVPVAYSAKGGAHARNLWLYKSEQAGAAAAAAVLRAMLVVFLRRHGPCVLRGAGMARPTHLAVVPSGRGRRGTHPLRALIAPYLAMPWAELSSRSSIGHPARDLDPDRFSAPRLPAARVLLMDDTWTSGASAQSAAMALRQAGARSVAVIVLGRHLTADENATCRAVSVPGVSVPGVSVPAVCVPPAIPVPAAMPFSLEFCAVHCVAGGRRAGGGRRDSAALPGRARGPGAGT